MLAGTTPPIWFRLGKSSSNKISNLGLGQTNRTPIRNRIKMSSMAPTLDEMKKSAIWTVATRGLKVMATGPVSVVQAAMAPNTSPLSALVAKQSARIADLWTKFTSHMAT